MIPLPAVNSQAQTQAQQLIQAQAQAAHLSQQLSTHPQSGKAASAASFASLSGGATGVGSGHTRKKSRMG